jgi:G:T-mismatch repair DNA endonuclease (very short patch repair protein)
MILTLPFHARVDLLALPYDSKNAETNWSLTCRAGRTWCSPALASLSFCDGDFWHGRNLSERIRRLAQGHNAPYWVEKIKSNVARDRRHDEALAGDGWLVLRFWETDIARDAAALAAQIAEVVSGRRG